jgi:hypothetical protein
MHHAPAPEARNEGGLLTLAVPAPGTGGTQFRTRLQDGLTHRVRYTVEVRPAAGGDPILTEILTTEQVISPKQVVHLIMVMIVAQNPKTITTQLSADDILGQKIFLITPR